MILNCSHYNFFSNFRIQILNSALLLSLLPESSIARLGRIINQQMAVWQSRNCQIKGIFYSICSFYWCLGLSLANENIWLNKYWTHSQSKPLIAYRSCSFITLNDRVVNIVCICLQETLFNGVAAFFLLSASSYLGYAVITDLWGLYVSTPFFQPYPAMTTAYVSLS